MAAYIIIHMQQRGAVLQVLYSFLLLLWSKCNVLLVCIIDSEVIHGQKVYQQEKFKKQQFTASDVDNDTSARLSYTEKSHVECTSLAAKVFN